MDNEQKNISICDECESEYYSDASQMSSLCPECSSILYGYENCMHEFENGRCSKCYWNGSASDFVQEISSMSSNKKVATFLIQNSYILTGHGPVILGQLTEGRVTIGDFITFTHDDKILTFMITGIEMADNISTRESWVGLTFFHLNEEQKLEFSKIKVAEQIVEITAGRNFEK